MSDASYVPDDHTYQSLHKEIDNGIHLLRKLSGLEKTHDVGKSQRLPVQELEQAAGLAIFEASKLGLVITGVSGRGFLIKKVGGCGSGFCLHQRVPSVLLDPECSINVRKLLTAHLTQTLRARRAKNSNHLRIL